jgi:CRISPR-associated endonuclease Csn1
MNQNLPYILGLDLGTNSIGWAVIRTDVSRDSLEPIELEAIGVRIFTAGVDGTTAEIQTGRDETRNAARQQARQTRRRQWRRRRRMVKLFRILQKNGLLPGKGEGSSEERHELLNALDAALRTAHLTGANEREHQLLPYLLRARALDQRLTPHELGRALYHLAQRRGFKSNRKQGPDPEDSTVYKGIHTLEDAIAESGSRTLGEYFFGLDPSEVRIRERWTAREMFEREFEAIWTAQSPHHTTLLTDSLREAVRKTIFFQRPLKVQKHLIGPCSLEPNKKRCPWWRPEAQEFRYLQRVNDLQLLQRDGVKIPLDKSQRQLVLNKLETVASLTFKQLRSLLKLPKNARFNLQAGGESKLPGHRSYAMLSKAYGKDWKTITADKRREILIDLASVEKEETFLLRCAAHGITDEAATDFAKNFKLEEGYCMLSAKALNNLLPAMRAGESFATVKTAMYPQEPGEELDALPPIHTVDETLNNPSVIRTLTELRKVVNGLIRLYGKPRHIRLEMGRDLKRSREERKRLSKRNRGREKDRDKARKLILEHGLHRASRADIEKVLLALECRYTCPYTGEAFGISDILGKTPRIEVEHIIPYSRSLDNSFANKTLCVGRENRLKRHRTPHEMYATDESRWDGILNRVSKFEGDYAERKLERFQWDAAQVGERLAGFTERQLNDTRYAARAAVDYLGSLYGAVNGVDKNDRRRITGVAGQTTATLRRAWNLEGLLSSTGLKTRDDHRHHAIDAITIGLTTVQNIQALSKAAQTRAKSYGRLELDVDPPITNLGFRTRELLEDVTVSPRVTHKLRGAYHQETLYGNRRAGGGPARDPSGVVRKRIESLTKSELEQIVDKAVRAAIESKLAEVGQPDPKKAFADLKNRPRIGANRRRINKVRIHKSTKMQSIGEGPSHRWVITGGNHHLAIFEVKTPKGTLKWEGQVVSLLDATKRKARGEPVIQRERADGARFVCSLMGGDVVTVRPDGEKGAEQFYVVRGISTFSSGQTEVTFSPINDARLIGEQKKAKDLLRTGPDSLRKLNLKKVLISPIGDVYPCGD